MIISLGWVLDYPQDYYPAVAALVPSAVRKPENPANDFVVSYCTTVWKDHGDSQCLPILRSHILAVNYVPCILLAYCAKCTFPNGTTVCVVACHSTRYWGGVNSSPNLNWRYLICQIQFQPPPPYQIELCICSHLLLHIQLSSWTFSLFCMLKLIPTEYSVSALYKLFNILSSGTSAVTRTSQIIR